MARGEWRGANDEGRMGNGEWRGANGKWGMGNEEWRSLREYLACYRLPVSSCPVASHSKAAD